MYLKRRDNVPHWAFIIGHMDYGCLMKFLEIYYENTNQKSLKKAYELGNVRCIRNACAHNNVFILNIFKDDNKLKNTTAAVNNAGSTKPTY